MRGKAIKKRVVKADTKYGNANIAKFINYLMLGGKKTIAQRLMYSALSEIETKMKKNPVEVFEEVIIKIAPQVEVRSKRVGGANYQVPIPVRGERQFALACRWIIGAARNIKGMSMSDKLAKVFMESYEGVGDAIKKRDDVHRMAEANKAFAHFARF